MHWNIEQVLWALVLAAHLVLLIVILGRDRAGRFPWFTAAIVLSTVRLLADHLLADKLNQIAFFWQIYALTGLDALIGLAVLVELARQVFSSGVAGLKLRANGWLGWALVTVPLAAAAVWAMGRPWPTWQQVSADPAQLPLLLVALSALKIQLFTGVMTVEVALLMRLFGARFGAGWRSHAQQIVLGLSTNALGFLSVQLITGSITRSLRKGGNANFDRERIGHLFANLDNARFALWILVLVWWTVWLWREDATDLLSLRDLGVDDAGEDTGGPGEIAGESELSL